MTAIATKKRLYEKALDSLTTSSQASLSSSTSSAPKRPATAIEAFDEARERAKKRLRHSTSSGSILPITLPSSTSTPQKHDTKSKDPPNYAPWSHEAFLARLKTFSSVSLWHVKPECISEVEWAKRGWSCVDVNTVRCKGGCEKRVVVSMDSPAKTAKVDVEGHEEDGAEGDEEDESAAFEQALAERYKDVIVDGHAETCLWRKGGCKDDIYHLQVVRPAIWQPALRQRFEACVSIKTAVEHIHTVPLDRSSPHLSPPPQILQNLPTTILGDIAADIPPALATKLLDIALHGWRGSSESGSELLHCDACFQRIGLWMYQPGYRPSHSTSPNNEENVEEEEDDDDDDDDAILNLLDLHREHCPWRNAASQKASGNLSGLNACQILQRVVSTCARDHKRRSDEQAGVPGGEVEGDDGGEGVVYSKEDIARQDKERESRLRKLKSLFSIKRRSTKSAPKSAAG